MNSSLERINGNHITRDTIPRKTKLHNFQTRSFLEISCKRHKRMNQWHSKNQHFKAYEMPSHHQTFGQQTELTSKRLCSLHGFVGDVLNVMEYLSGNCLIFIISLFILGRGLLCLGIILTTFTVASFSRSRALWLLLKSKKFGKLVQ